MPLTYPTGQGTETATGFAITPAKFHEAFAADLPETQTAVMAVTQRPSAEAAFGEPTGEPAWKTLPSWAVMATGDKAAGSDVVRSMAERAGAQITEAGGLARDHDLATPGRHGRHSLRRLPRSHDPDRAKPGAGSRWRTVALVAIGHLRVFEPYRCGGHRFLLLPRLRVDPPLLH